MQAKLSKTAAARLRRRKHIRKVVRGSADRPRLVVHRSLKGIYAQLVDDVGCKVITGINWRNTEVQKELKEAKGKIAVAAAVGKALAALAKKHGIERVVFDRSGYRYHGRVKAVADAARKGGLTF
jgi:large subunit ribosomal protein L18